MFCSNCGREIPEDAKVCTGCGECILPPPGDNYTDNDGQATFYNDEYPIANKQVRPLSTLHFLAMQIVLFIPILNIILLFIWSFRNNTNLNRKAYSRSILVWIIAFCVAFLFVILTFVFMGYPISADVFVKLLKDAVNSIPE